MHEAFTVSITGVSNLRACSALPCPSQGSWAHLLLHPTLSSQMARSAEQLPDKRLLFGCTEATAAIAVSWHDPQPLFRIHLESRIALSRFVHPSSALGGPVLMGADTWTSQATTFWTSTWTCFPRGQHSRKFAADMNRVIARPSFSALQ